MELMTKVNLLNSLIDLRKIIIKEATTWLPSDKYTRDLKLLTYLTEINVIKAIMSSDSEGMEEKDLKSFSKILDEMEELVLEGKNYTKYNNLFINHLYNLSNYIKNKINKNFILSVANNIEIIIEKDNNKY